MENDQISWKPDSSGNFSCSSLYCFLNTTGVKCKFTSSLWSISIPLKIKCFLWLCWKNKLNTRELLGKKTRRFLDGCAICNQVPESTDQLCSTCPFFSSIWKAVCSALEVLHPQSSLGLDYKELPQEDITSDLNASCSCDLELLERTQCKAFPP